VQAQARQFYDQLSAFSSFPVNFSSPVNGTIVRLPLRTSEDAAHSRIKQEETSADSIYNLMDTFIETELEIALLFLKHLKVIELKQVLENGKVQTLARAELLDIPGPRPSVRSDDANAVDSRILRVRVSKPKDSSETKDWLVRHEVGDVELVSTQLAVTPVTGKRNTLREEKLYPHVAIALPLSSQAMTGRLFTYLPLPIKTGFPVHVHALFSLTSDRQRSVILEVLMTYLTYASSASEIQARGHNQVRRRIFFNAGTGICSRNSSPTRGRMSSQMRRHV